MFQKILQWVREVLNKMLNSSNVKQALNVQPLLTELMTSSLQKWCQMYINQSPWLTGGIKSLNLPAAIASEVARSVTIEMDVQLNGSPRAEFLATQLVPVLNNIRTYTEYATAKGGLMFKPYPRADGTIAVDYVQADQFYPVAFDANRIMTACVFADTKVVGQTYYTRFEYHAMGVDGYRITNTAYRSTVRDNLGTRVALSEVVDWADLEPEVTILNIARPLFAYFPVPMANNIDPTSPLGVSIYARAVDLIEQADRQWTDFLWEFESGKRALYTDPLAFKKGEDGKPVLPDKRLYRLLDLQGKIDQKGLFEEWTPTLRETNMLNGLDAILRKVEFNCGLSYGILSNPEAVALTATEIKAGKQRLYATVTDTQKSLQDAFDGLLYAMNVWATLMSLAPAGTYTATYYWDDSIVSDHDTQFTQDQQTMTSNAMSKKRFLMRNYGLSEEDAMKWVEEAKTESPTPSFFPADIVDGGGV